MAVFAFGSNAISQLGLGEDADSTHIPTRLSFFDGMSLTKIRCGSLHTLILNSNGELYSWGCNDEGALGREGDESIPGIVPLGEKIVDMGCGASISAAVSDTGNLYVWGTFRSTSGRYGLLPGKRISFEPVKTPSRNIISIGVGQNFIAALDSCGACLTFGSNEFGELGRRTSERNKLRALIPDLVTAPRKYRFISVGCGLNHVMALNEDGDAYCWGSNLYGQLGHDEAEMGFKKHKIGVPGVIQAVGGENHSLFLTMNGELYACGRNREGQLGFESTESIRTPTKLELSGIKRIRSYNSFNVCQIGNNLYSWGTGFSGALGFEEETIHTPRMIPFECSEIIDFDVGNDFVIVITN